jgi:hypothetical protein
MVLGVPLGACMIWALCLPIVLVTGGSTAVFIICGVGGLAASALLVVKTNKTLVLRKLEQSQTPLARPGPEQKCSNCGTVYKPADYNPEATKWLCAECKNELPKEIHAPG